jgi:uncharacterized membrane protein
MERLLAVVFNDEAKAYEGVRALKQLDDEGSITAYAAQVIQKNADGKVSVKQTEGNFPLQTAKGLWIGSLIGLLGGPAGVALGAAAGTSAGAIGDLNIADVNADFVEEVSSALAPGTYAVVVDASEEWVTPVDSRMEALGGLVFRTQRKQFEEESRARDVAMLKAEIDELKTEQAQERAERKSKLQEKIDKLKAKLQLKLEEAKQRSEQIKSETDAKVEALEKKAASAKGELKAAMQARISELRKDYDKSAAKLKSFAA